MNEFEKEEIVRDLREGQIVFCAYMIDKSWWDHFWSEMAATNINPDIPPINNTRLV